jgi:UDPglucose 6-dehydrogenase
MDKASTDGAGSVSSQGNGVARIAIVGTGYVELAYAVAFAELGNIVTARDIDASRVDQLSQGIAPLYEPGLAELLRRNLDSGRLRFTTSLSLAVPEADFVFICVGTPSLSSGEADMRQVRDASVQIGRHLQPGRRVVIVNKSTMPIGSGDFVSEVMKQVAPPGSEFAVVSNPEFLREGQAIKDIFSPDRIVLGSDDIEASRAVAALYTSTAAPVLYTDPRSAEMVKYASNAFLATKISFINEVAQVCARLNADVLTVARGLGMDSRIGSQFLEAGLGFGGSCFPKDVAALTRMADAAGLHPQLLRAVVQINTDMRRQFVHRAEELLGGLDGRVIAVLGLAFKQDTDDLRDSPALSVVAMVEERGGLVRAYDPAAMDNARRVLPTVTMCLSAYEAARGADAVMVVTPWQEFRDIDLRTLRREMRGNLLLDGRNLYDPENARASGLKYEGIGRQQHGKARIQSRSSVRSLALDPVS